MPGDQRVDSVANVRARAVPVDQVAAGIAYVGRRGWRGRRRNRRDDSARRIAEARASVGVLDREAAFVDRHVVVVAEQDGVVLARRAALRPMLDVVPLEAGLLIAAGETTATVAHQQRTHERWRDRASPTPDVQRIARFVGLHDHDPAVACQAAQRITRQRRAIV